MSSTFVSIGIDVGHSSVKIAVTNPSNGGHVIYDQMQSVVSNWKQLNNPETAKLAQKDTVEVRGQKYFIGNTAAFQSRAESFTGQSRNWIDSDEHDALILGAWEKAQRILQSSDKYFVPAQIFLVMGLPTAYFFQQKDKLKERVLRIIQPRLAPLQKLEVNIQSQSIAPLFNLALDEHGSPTGKVTEEDSWGSIEIGHYTTDFSFQDHGQEIDEASTSHKGVILIYEQVKEGLKKKEYLHDLQTIDRAVKTKTIKVYGEEVDVSGIVNPAINNFANTLKDHTSNLFKESAQRMDGIIVAGGGAEIPGIFATIKSIYPNAVTIPNPQFAVANGLVRFGLLLGK
jgi:plasmid segregation protein ParM